MKRVVVCLATVWFVACEVPTPEGDPCGAHGELHGDHCHCDAGFTERDGVCVAAPAGDSGVQVDQCGEHGELHVDHCDCHDGYVEVNGVCVAQTVDAGGDRCAPNGHLHGDHCHCDTGFEETNGTCVAVDMCGPHGHSHGAHCDCDGGYEEVNGVCVVVAVDAGVDACGPNGHSHGNHCHCDSGFEELNGTCVAVTDAGVDPCAPNGELHGNHCHCDSGYVEMGLSCVPVMIASCGNGHRHGGTCVCYAGFVYSAVSDTCEAVVPPSSQPVIGFTIVALGEDMSSSGMNAVNDSRQVVGNKRPTGQTYLSAYTQSVTAMTASAITDVGILPNSSNNFSRPWDINASGVVVGESGNNNPVLPFIYDGALRQLALPTGSTSAVAHGINDAGKIVGIGNSRALVWTSSTATPTYLANLAGATVLTSRAWKVNEAGDIVGHARDAMSVQHAAWWKPDGSVVDLGTLNPSYAAEALDVNEAARIVGKSVVGVVPGSTSGTLQWQAFLFENGSMRGLGTLPSAPMALHSIANAINDDGWVVGQVEQVAGIAARAVLWRDGVIVDLNDYLPANSGWVLTSAVDVNSQGDIVGRGTLNGSARPFMLVRTN